MSKIAEVIDGLELRADGVRHIVLDFRGLTFMDVLGLNELIKENEYARSNSHNLADVRGSDEIQRVLKLTGVEDLRSSWTTPTTSRRRRRAEARRGVVWRAGWLHGQQSRPKRVVRRRANHATRYRTNGDEIDCGASFPTRPLSARRDGHAGGAKRGPTMPSDRDEGSMLVRRRSRAHGLGHAQRRVSRRVRRSWRAAAASTSRTLPER